MIRPAILDDVPALVDMGRRFHGASGYETFIPLVEGDLARSLRRIIRSSDARIVVYEAGGVIAGVAGVATVRSFFNKDVLIGVEQFVFLDNEHRGRRVADDLITRLEDEARDIGCKTMTLIGLENCLPDIVHDIYVRHGYELVEHAYMKRL